MMMCVKSPMDFAKAMRLLCLLFLAANGAGFSPIGLGSENVSSLDSRSNAVAPFSIRQDGDAFWLCSPAGQRFFSFGVCCVGTGISRQDYDPENPSYAAWHHYDSDKAWADATQRRLSLWGFTTAAGWSDVEALRQSTDTNLFFTPVLHIGSTAGAPWWDMWDPKIIQRMDDTARSQILAVRDDPRLLGYYSDNEMGWWNATLFKMTLEQPSSSGQRQRLMRLLKERYDNDWQRLEKDFQAEGAANWTELERAGMLYLRPGGRGIESLRSFLGLLAQRYYSLVYDIIRKYDSRALILGDRYQSFYYPEVARACSQYVDAVSSNLNAGWSDGSFPRFYLDTLHALAAKPVFVSEIYMAAMENRSGNRNSSAVFPVVKTQKERATGFQNTISQLLRRPFVLGIDWFQYFDEPTHGRADGENYNFGLVDIHDRPYEAIIRVAAGMKKLELARAARPPLDASQGVPPATANPLAHFEPMQALMDWDRERGFVPSSSAAPMADLYVCWSEKAIFLGLYSLDITEDAYYRDRRIPREDRAQWFVSIAGRGQPIRARIGSGREPLVNEPMARVENVSGLGLNVRNIACMELPASLFGKKRFRAGNTIDFSSTLLTHCQAYRVEWKGRFTLRSRF
jgi:hypothetical protein